MPRSLTLPTRAPRRRLAGALATLALLLLAACGGGGAGELPLPGGGTQAPPAPPATATGEVTLTIKDAPLSQLQTFTIDVTKAVLKGAGVADATIFQTTQTTGPVTIDLLQVQGFNQLLAGASIPVGNYYSVEVDFANPAATSFAGQAQNITTNGTNKLTGVFQPTLAVTQGSSQTVQVDVDLQSSVVDLGGNDIFFAPFVLVQVLNQPTPVRKVTAFVVTTDVPNDRFEADILLFSHGRNTTVAHAPRGGHVRVQCDASTIHKDTNGQVTTGGVTAKLLSGDLVEIDGTMMNGRIDAQVVAALARGNGSNPGQPTNPAPWVNMSGTLLSVDAQASTATIKVHHAHGPGTQSVQAFSDVTWAIDSQAFISRFGMTRTLGQLVPGNTLNLHGDHSGTTFTAKSVDEAPAFIAGTATGVTVGTQLDEITFTPEMIDQILVSQLTFIPASLRVEFPTPSGVQVNDKIRFAGFFNAGTDLVETAFNGGPLPPPPPPQFFVGGHLKQGTTATLGATDATFTLDIGMFSHTGGNLPGGNRGPISGGGTNTNTGPVFVDVTVPATATIGKMDASGNITTLSLGDLVTELNSSADYFVNCEGSAAPTAGAFTADLTCTIHLIVPPNHVFSGELTQQGTAQVSNNGLYFPLATLGPAVIGFPSVLNVSVGPNASITRLDQNGVATLTPAEAALAINTRNFEIQVEGTNPPSQNNAFTADVSVMLFQKFQPTPGTPPGGNLPPGGNTPPGGGHFPPPGGGQNPGGNTVWTFAGTVAGNATADANGNVTFTMLPWLGNAAQTTITVIVPATALRTLLDPVNPPQTISPAEAVTALNANPSQVMVEGSFSTASGIFNAHKELAIFK